MHKRHIPDPASHDPSTAPVPPKDPRSPHLHRALGGDPQSHLKHHHGSPIASGSGSFSSGSKVRLSSVYAISLLSLTMSCYAVSAILIRRWHQSVLSFSHPQSRHSSHSAYARRVSSARLSRSKRQAYSPLRLDSRPSNFPWLTPPFAWGSPIRLRGSYTPIVHVLR